uniref:Uncharacterized protein n=1 Tax=Cryptomonas curvata TaxID=233186 RepID=A0A7S0MMG2_9CRYP
MFALVSTLLAQGSNLCVTDGICTAPPDEARDVLSFAVHTSVNGVYTAEQVIQYRNCSNDHTTKFASKWDGNPWSGKGVKGFSPVGGNSKIESFRICWEPLNLQYPTSTS